MDILGHRVQPGGYCATPRDVQLRNEMDRNESTPPLDDCKVVGMAGKAGSGKDYLAREALVRGRNYVPIDLAHHMKLTAILQYGISAAQAFGWEDRRDDIRTFLQTIGTEVGRNGWGRGIWLTLAEARMRELRDKGVRRFVITDVRFPNEAEWIRRLEAQVALIRVYGRGGLDEEHDSHDSESQIQDLPCTHEVDNSVERARRVSPDHAVEEVNLIAKNL